MTKRNLGSIVPFLALGVAVLALLVAVVGIILIFVFRHHDTANGNTGDLTVGNLTVTGDASFDGDVTATGTHFNVRNLRASNDMRVVQQLKVGNLDEDDGQHTGSFHVNHVHANDPEHRVVRFFDDLEGQHSDDWTIRTTDHTGNTGDAHFTRVFADNI